MRRIMLIAIALFTVMALAACSSGNSASQDKGTASQQSAPNFTLTDLNGKTHSLKDYAGQKVYVKFWASWCSICLAGLEEVNTLAKEEQDFVVLSVVAPGYKNEKDTAAFKKWFSGVEEAPDLTVLLDEGGKVAEQFQVRGYPTSAYIDSSGKLIQTLPGHVGNEQIIEKFKTIQ